MLLAWPLVQTAAIPQPAFPLACCREDLKHLKAKLKKLDEKMAKDGGWQLELVRLWHGLLNSP